MEDFEGDLVLTAAHVIADASVPDLTAMQQVSQDHDEGQDGQESEAILKHQL